MTIDREMLRFTTAGSVDDGKSTLIGRLLYDSKSIFEDQYEAIKSATERRGGDGVDLALLTDGLRAEREQGITIDVAYRYFATPRRKFIIADTPGHVQYTRNMVTGASTAHVALILVDARKGVVEQTRRHACIASLLGIPHVALCVNKMDLVGFDEGVFAQIRADVEAFAAHLDPIDWRFLPISALQGDNVVEPSQNMPWYAGAPLLELLETIPVDERYDPAAVRLPVQYVLRPEGGAGRRYLGRLAGGLLRPGDRIVALPSGQESSVEAIETMDGALPVAYPLQSVAVRLTDEIDVSRGDMLVAATHRPEATQEVTVNLCWLGEKPMVPGGRYALKHTSRDARALVREVVHKIDIETLQPRVDGDTTVAMNDIARVVLKTTVPLCVDPYRQNRTTGSLILIDEGTNVTVGAAMVA